MKIRNRSVAKTPKTESLEYVRWVGGSRYCKFYAFFICALVLVINPDLRAEQLRPITPRDCVTVRRLLNDNLANPIQINLQGTRVAYLVNAPNLATNENDVQLYIRAMGKTEAQQSRLVLVAHDMHDLHWLGDGEHITVSLRDSGTRVIAVIDVITGKRHIIARIKGVDIQEYAVDRSGRTVAFAIDSSPKGTAPTPQEAANGYLIPFAPPTQAQYHQAKLFLVQRRTEARWTKPQEMDIHSPFTHIGMQTLPYLISLHLSLSPDGDSLLFSYRELEHLPDAWKVKTSVQGFSKHGVPIELIALYSVRDKTTSISLNSTFVYRTPVWSADSRAFIAVTTMPVDRANNSQTDADSNSLPAPYMFRVDRGSKTIEQVTGPSVVAPQVMAWQSDRNLLLRTGPYTITKMSHRNMAWLNDATIHVPIRAPRTLDYPALASNGQYVIGDYQDASTPPELYAYKVGQPSMEVVSRLNLQFDSLTIAPTKTFEWTVADGYKISGTMWMPPNYVPGRMYPLVIQTKPDAGGFACDSGDNHDPSFAPQPIADAGMIYLARTWPEDFRYADDEAHYPKGYPGGIAEAAFHMDIWDSAIRTLTSEGVVDPSRVGIIGFSRSGWYTEFILAHSTMHYAAATAADNIQYSAGEYWLRQTAQSIQDSETMYGGPPYGEMLNSWLEYSISFTSDKIRSPLLMEVFGDGTKYTPGQSLPDLLAPSFEVFTALKRLQRPVDLYYYPNDKHQPDHPLARLSSLQRNLDWYSFWLQGFDRSDANDLPQYRRWHEMRQNTLHSQSSCSTLK